MPIKGLKGGIGTKALGYGLGGAAAEETDAEFNQTVLLLHGDGSEGEGDTAALGDPNYKAFKDNSTSAHAIVVQGDAYGNDFSPYYYADGYWSVLFDGNDNIRFGGTSDESAFQFGTGEFTIEFFVKLQGATSLSEYGFFGCINGFYFQLYQGTLEYHTSSKDFDIPYTPNNNAFVHFAISRDSSNNLRLWIDGTLTHTVASHTYDYSTIAGFQVMDIGTVFSRPGKGYLSNFRVVKGSAVYSGTGSITVPTAPLTAISGTTLLACQSNRFLDNSTSGLAPTPTGDPAVSTNTPFTQSKTANVGSGFFDGTGDELEITNSSDFAFGTGDFQISLWVYLLENSGGLVGLTGGTAVGYWCLTANGGTLYFQDQHNAHDLFSTTLPSLHAWHFIEVSRVSSTTKMFIDGVQTNTTSDTTDYNQTGQTLDIGDHGGHGEPKGYIADVRIIKGSGVTSSTLPTTSLTAVTNTKLLTCQYSGAVRNVGFLDDSKYNHQITRNGDVSMGTFSPFSLEDGYWSNFFDGTDDYLTVPNSTDTKIGAFTEDYTLECWFQLTASGAAEVLFGQSDGSGTNPKWIIGIDMNSSAAYSANKVGVYSFSGGTAGDGTYSPGFDVGTWYHFRLVYTHSGTTLKVYINGTEVVSNAGNVVSSSGAFTMGADGEGNGDFNGYISNIRLIKGTALDSTVPTEPLTAVTNTKLLTAQSNRFVDNSSSPLTITITGTPKVLPFSPFAPTRAYTKDAVGGSAYFDETNDHLETATASNEFNLGTGQFTFEAWIYTQSTNQQTIMIAYVGTTDFNIYIHDDAVHLYTSSVIINGNSGSIESFIQKHAWNHIVMQRDSSNYLTVYVNGVRKYYTVDATDFGATSKIRIGEHENDSNEFKGYIADVRFVNGSAVYSGATITVPTSPLTAVTNTKLLLNFNNAGIIDHTMKNNLETEGNTRISGQQVKFGTGSMYFDGNGDYLTGVNQPYLTIGTGSYTFECWVYITTGVQQYHGLLSIVGGIQFQLSDERMRLSTTGGQIMIADVADAISLNTWTHLAFVRDASASNALKFFKNGTLIKSGTDSTNWNHTGALQVGRVFNSSTYDIEGYLDDVRLTLAPRYTSSFTAPTKAFANK